MLTMLGTTLQAMIMVMDATPGCVLALGKLSAVAYKDIDLDVLNSAGLSHNA